MDRAKNEFEIVIEVVNGDREITELNELQLAFVGGGSGDTIMY